MNNLVRIDLLGGKNVPCHDCGNQFAIHIAVNTGLMQEPLCFKCIMEHLDEQNLIVN
jgi:hypothetical protein